MKDTKTTPQVSIILKDLIKCSPNIGEQTLGQQAERYHQTGPGMIQLQV